MTRVLSFLRYGGAFSALMGALGGWVVSIPANLIIFQEAESVSWPWVAGICLALGASIGLAIEVKQQREAARLLKVRF